MTSKEQTTWSWKPLNFHSSSTLTNIILHLCKPHSNLYNTCQSSKLYIPLCLLATKSTFKTVVPDVKGAWKSQEPFLVDKNSLG